MIPKALRPSSILVLLLWLVIVIGVSARHEIGKDEARALILAVEAPSYLQLPAAIHNEGHPILWYALLRMAHSIFPHPVVLKIVNIALAFGAVLLFFRYSPFSIWQRVLFIFGVFPLFEYGVICRNYAISMLFFFAFAALYPQRKQKPLLLALVLAFLANTNAFACIFAGLLAVYWLLDEIQAERRAMDFHRAALLTLSFFIIGAAIIYAIAISLPPRDTVLTQCFSVSFAQVGSTFFIDLVNPGPHFTSAFAMLSNPLRNLLFYSLIAGLLIRPLAAATFWVGTASMCAFFSTVYGSHARHQGLIVLFIITLYWIVYRQISLTAPVASIKKRWGNMRRVILSNWARTNGFRDRLAGRLTVLHLLAVYLVLTGIFVFHIAVAAYRVRADVNGEMSSNKAFAEFLAAHPEYDNAIIIGEPDYNLVSLLYYTSRRFYIAREDRFGHITKWTAACKANLSLGELLDAAQKVKEAEQKPVLIAIGHEAFSKADSLYVEYSYNRLFTATTQEMTAFRSQTAKIAEFTHATTDENWEVYLLR